jgi:predicted site-specific integrase-resolvase
VCDGRVSSPAQRPDGKKQRRIVEEYALGQGMAKLELIEEMGGGLNCKRPKFRALVDSVVADEVAKLVVAHQDGWARFGFELLPPLCRKHGWEWLVRNTEKVSPEPVSPEPEMVQDWRAITHGFSFRLYGFGNYRRALKWGVKVILAHRIELDPTEKQKAYFRQACGAARFVWNWALAEWNDRYELGANPDAWEVKRYFNPSSTRRSPG